MRYRSTAILVAVVLSVVLWLPRVVGGMHMWDAFGHASTCGTSQGMNSSADSGSIQFPKAGPFMAGARSAGSAWTRWLLDKINSDRLAAQLPPLTMSTAINQAALSHSLDMASHSYLSHFTLSGASPYQRLAILHINYKIAGENVGFDSGAGRRVMLRAIDEAMLLSPEHRANLLRSAFKQVGIGIATVRDRVYVTEDFKS